MLASGCFHRSEPHMKKAEQFIISHGGLRHVHFMTKWMLAANGLYPWPALYLPLSLMALPPTLPIHFYQFSSYARIHFAPMAVTLNQRFVLINRNISSLHHLDPHMTKILSLGFGLMLSKKEISRLFCHIGNAFFMHHLLFSSWAYRQLKRICWTGLKKMEHYTAMRAQPYLWFTAFCHLVCHAIPLLSGGRLPALNHW